MATADMFLGEKRQTFRGANCVEKQMRGAARVTRAGGFITELYCDGPRNTATLGFAKKPPEYH